MFNIRNIQKTCISMHIRLNHKVKCLRRHGHTSSYKIVLSDDPRDDIQNPVSDLYPNWELLTPQGFRFYLPGSIGPGWLNARTIARAEIQSSLVPNEIEDLHIAKLKKHFRRKSYSVDKSFSFLHFTAQECPTLLRKGILELFPGCLEVTSPELTMITISQFTRNKASKWSKEALTEKLAQYFVLAASDMCNKLKTCGFWADFINPFSGQPYLNPHNNKVLYKTDERFRCVGFKVRNKINCRIISHDNNTRNFIG
ncbi:PREDICTED: methylmalonic aciduria and homocystinuria type D homolog, mitochondrial [Ceratosolen solmsi marchali]|uniref:Methylmalonic aciduria and homocystinuria type D homolog, mitochondrial n=1 Tax=Ceratosolen solmsi marchali TaxID=326594 RepID=A0AAJ6YJ02_9HYME|nr:PREDICTED: methylmalonic aciduria and homocystinuria type D homolog, mitochondrial [Ceratosolen solmsi marchali]XP_011498950.1 PREDICTED: methylmalonic aciduria and homocystinuria type D homolog, mitochondrial [Ceratosolen solmsi marchali]